MDNRFTNKVAIVTGSGRGIGRATAVGLAREGARVVVHDRDQAPAAETTSLIKGAGGDCILVTGDVTREDDVARLFDATADTFGPLDILVANAGVIKPAMITRMTPEEWDYVVDTNMKGVFLCLQEAGKVFQKKALEQRDAPEVGAVVTVASAAGLRGTVGQINYGAAKAGVIGMTMSAAREWGRFRVRVNAVAFGVIETRLSDTVRADEKFAHTYLDQIVLGRFGTVDDAAGPILFLAGPEASYITGETLNVSGGFHIGF